MTFEKIMEAMEEMTMPERINIHNEYCDQTHDCDCRIYYMEEFNTEVFLPEGSDLLWLAYRIHFGDFNPNDEYFAWDAYGNLVSFSTKYELEEYMHSMEVYAEHIAKNFEDYAYLFDSVDLTAD